MNVVLFFEKKRPLMWRVTRYDTRYEGMRRFYFLLDSICFDV